MKTHVLYGTGEIADRFLYGFKDRKDIAFCVDDTGDRLFRGLPVYKIEEAYDMMTGYHIIVATEWKKYLLIKENLVEHGFEEFKDFIWYKGVDKKMVVLNCNCHGVSYREYLNKSKAFNEKYYIYRIPYVHRNDKIEDNILNNCDVFIHQVMRVGNSISDLLSDEYCYARLKKDARIIVVPNYVGIGTSLFTGGEKKFVIGNDIDYMLEDTYIEEAYDRGLRTVEEVKTYVLGKKRKGIKEEWEKAFNKLKEREQKWDIKISDYVEANIKKKKIFCDLAHPSYDLIQETCLRLGRYMELWDCEDIRLERRLNWVEMFIYPDVYDALGFEYEFENVIREKSDFWLTDSPMSLDEYIRQYYYIVKNMMIE